MLPVGLAVVLVVVVEAAVVSTVILGYVGHEVSCHSE